MKQQGSDAGISSCNRREDWGTEYLDYILSVKVVDSVEKPLHISINIIQSIQRPSLPVIPCQKFLDEVDAASFM